MKISKLLIAATGIEAVTLGAVLAAGGLAAGLDVGRETLTGTLDVINQFAPFILGLIAAGAVLVAFGLERRRAKAVFLTIAVVSFLAYCPPFIAEHGARALLLARADEPRPADLKLLQFNVLQTNFRPDLAEAAVLDNSPDVIAFQEPHPHILSSPVLRQAYPYRTDCVGYCLVMIWSKRPITQWKHEVSFDTRGPNDPGAEVLYADTTAPDGKPVRVMTTHYVWPIPSEPQRLQRTGFADHLAGMDKRSLILAADFNLTPWSFALREQDRRLDPLRRRTRAVNTWPAYIPRLWRPTNFTFLPIDHVYAGPDWRTVSVGRTDRGASDHYPVMAVLRREASAASASEPADSSPLR